MSQVFEGTNDYPRAKAFYDAVLATLHIGVVMEHAGAAVAARLERCPPVRAEAAWAGLHDEDPSTSSGRT